MQKKIAAAQFKAQCLQLMDDVKEKQLSFIITKHGIPVAKLVPINEQPMSLYGALKGAMNIKGDIISSVNEKWEEE